MVKKNETNDEQPDVADADAKVLDAMAPPEPPVPAKSDKLRKGGGELQTVSIIGYGQVTLSSGRAFFLTAGDTLRVSSADAAELREQGFVAEG